MIDVFLLGVVLGVWFSKHLHVWAQIVWAKMELVFL